MQIQSYSYKDPKHHRAAVAQESGEPEAYYEEEDEAAVAQKYPKKLTLLPQLKLKGREEEKEKGRAKVAKDKGRRATHIVNFRSVQSPLPRPHSIYMVSRGQKRMFTFLNIPMD